MASAFSRHVFTVFFFLCVFYAIFQIEAAPTTREQQQKVTTFVVQYNNNSGTVKENSNGTTSRKLHDFIPSFTSTNLHPKSSKIYQQQNGATAHGGIDKENLFPEKFYDVRNNSIEEADEDNNDSHYGSAEMEFVAEKHEEGGEEGERKKQHEEELANFCMMPKSEETKAEEEGERKLGNNIAVHLAQGEQQTTPTPPTTPVPFEWVDSTVSINLALPIRILQAQITLMLGVERKSDGTYCVKLHGFGLVPHIFSTFEMKWEKQQATKAAGTFSARANAEWQIWKGGMMFVFPMKVVARVLAQKMVNAMRRKTVTTWDDLAQLLALDLIKLKPPTATEWAQAVLEHEGSDESANNGIGEIAKGNGDDDAEWHVNDVDDNTDGNGNVVMEENKESKTDKFINSPMTKNNPVD